MSVLGRVTFVAAVFTGSVAVAAVAVNDDRVYDAVTGSMGSMASHFVTAGSMVAGDTHLAAPELDTVGDKLYDDRIASSSVVTHVEVIGGGPKQRIVLLNPDGQEVFSHDPAANTTIVAKDAIIPSITVRDNPGAVAELRVVTAAPVVEAPEELRQALAYDDPSPTLFYREDL